MKLNTESYPPSLTLRDLHLERGDYVLASRWGDVVVKFLGSAWLVVFRDACGVACEHLSTKDADAFYIARFVAEWGALPVNTLKSRKPTLRGLQPVKNV